MRSKAKLSETSLHVLSNLRKISGNGPLLLNQEDVAHLLKDLELLHRTSLELEDELEGLSKVREFIMSVSKTDIRFTHPETHRKAFSVVGGTEAITPEIKQETGNV